MKCSFCKKDVEKGTGKVYIKKDGKSFNFCSMKCEKHVLQLGRKPQKTKWVKE